MSSLCLPQMENLDREINVVVFNPLFSLSWCSDYHLGESNCIISDPIFLRLMWSWSRTKWPKLALSLILFHPFPETEKVKGHENWKKRPNPPKYCQKICHPSSRRKSRSDDVGDARCRDSFARQKSAVEIETDRLDFFAAASPTFEISCDRIWRVGSN